MVAGYPQSIQFKSPGGRSCKSSSDFPQYHFCLIVLSRESLRRAQIRGGRGIPQWEELPRTHTCPKPQHGLIYKLTVYASTSETTQGMDEEESWLLTASSGHLLAHPNSLHSRSRSRKHTSSCPLLSSHSTPVTILSTYVYQHLDPHHNPVEGVITVIISILQKRKLSHMKVNSPV